MWIIRIQADASGMHSPVQSWADANAVPSGFATITDDQLSLIFPEGKEAGGFVTFDVEDGKAVNIEWNEEAYQEYMRNRPEPEPEEPTEEDDVNAMLVDHEYRLTLLELGITE